MTVRFFLLGSTSATIVAAILWFLTVNYIDPNQAGLLGFLLFYLTLFVAVTGFASLVGYFARHFLAPQLLPAYAVRSSVRQGILLGCLLDVFLLLQQLRLYRWWLTVLALVALLAVELVFLNYDRAAKRSALANKE